MYPVYERIALEFLTICGDGDPCGYRWWLFSYGYDCNSRHRSRKLEFRGTMYVMLINEGALL
jgi:hypothetical protein